MKYIPRLTAPSASDKNFIHYSKGGYNTCIIIDSKTGSVLPNCVGYAQGRLLELLGKKAVNWKLPACNAEDWLATATKAGFKTGLTPKLGAVICWRAGQVNNSSDGAGHVAVVEQIMSNGDIVVSQSAYGGDRFYMKTLTKASGYVYASTRQFLGFIYCGIEFDADVEPSPSTTGSITAGKKVTLNNTKCYSSEGASSAYGVKSGVFYLWDATVKNGRIRITNAANRVGVAGQVTCWVAIADVGLTASGTSTSTSIKAGAKYTLSNAPVYSSESGASIGTRSGVYYTWDAVIKNGRIRMTNSAARVGVAGQVSFFADTSSLK